MTKLFKKLNFKAHPVILSLNHPDSFLVELEEMKAFATVVHHLKDIETIDFAIAFGIQQKEVDELTEKIAPKLSEDAVFWFCYPKKSSKKYKCEFNRDTGWAIMGKYNLEGVRQVAIDEDWSALRFRNVDKIKKFTRRTSMALSKKGKERTEKNKQ